MRTLDNVSPGVLLRSANLFDLLNDQGPYGEGMHRALRDLFHDFYPQGLNSYRNTWTQSHPVGTTEIAWLERAGSAVAHATISAGRGKVEPPNFVHGVDRDVLHFNWISTRKVDQGRGYGAALAAEVVRRVQAGELSFQNGKRPTLIKATADREGGRRVLERSGFVRAAHAKEGDFPMPMQLILEPSPTPASTRAPPKLSSPTSSESIFGA